MENLCQTFFLKDKIEFENVTRGSLQILTRRMFIENYTLFLIRIYFIRIFKMKFTKKS